ncbi:hypothetical protein PS880_03753 [Pseudomonas fluorescens]|uniref:Uncharacterized protein n=1 Tax=Pseudomonas fluorescens TaxID=294 RepID=A0A5E7M603_PSEFL|nr:hypothetical protein PS880_03753 [Pseudomonas fluorescens]
MLLAVNYTSIGFLKQLVFQKNSRATHYADEM